MRYIGFFILFFCFIFSFSTLSQEEQKQTNQSPQECSVANENDITNRKPRYCFFSLNGKDESEGICNNIRKELQSKEISKTIEQENLSIPSASRFGQDNELVIDKGNESGCKNLPYKDIEIAEYYSESSKEEGPTEDKHIEDSFRKMTQDRCDALVISGHHVGYFTGSKQKNRSKKNVTLTLDFLEKFSCKSEGCMAWFDNIKMLQLHGSRTWGQSTHTDQAVPKLFKNYPETVQLDVESLHREYANTVDTDNPLSHRYLRMFPKASVLAWGGQAPSIKKSIATFTAYLERLGKKENADESNLLKGFNQLASILKKQQVSPDDHEAMCTSWKDPGGPGFQREAIFGDDGYGGDLEEDRKKGCVLSQAINSKNATKEDIDEALDSILDNGDGRASQRIHQNLNRIIQALHLDNSLSLEKRQAFINKLKTSNVFQQTLTQKIEDDKLGLVRRADYLALYKKIPFADNEDFQQTELGFFQNLSKAVEDNKGRTCGQNEELCRDIKIVTAEMLAEIIWKNNLGLSQEQVEQQVGAESTEKFSDVLSKIVENIKGTNGEDKALEMHALLLDLNFKHITSQAIRDNLESILKFKNGLEPFHYVDNTLLRGVASILDIKGAKSREDFWSEVERLSAPSLAQ